MSTKFDEKTIQKRINQKYGQGEYENYKPWLTVRDVSSSKSRSNRPFGWKAKRDHHLLSDLEYYYFLYLEWSDVVSDIREQYPLNREESIDIAKSVGLKHPYIYDTYQVMTTDFFILLEDGRYIARTVKEAKELEDRRVIEKFEIERLYWETKDVDWGIVTRGEIDKALVRNLEILHPAKSFLDEFNNPSVVNNILKYLSTCGYEVAEILDSTDEAFGLELGTSLAVYKSAIANKLISIDMFELFDVGILSDNVVVNISAQEKFA
ncbi:TnsA endonuclease N-terminal domain-containing protein [Deferribacteres bacterium DY0037]